MVRKLLLLIVLAISSSNVQAFFGKRSSSAQPLVLTKQDASEATQILIETLSVEARTQVVNKLERDITRVSIAGVRAVIAFSITYFAIALLREQPEQANDDDGFLYTADEDRLLQGGENDTLRITAAAAAAAAQQASHPQQQQQQSAERALVATARGSQAVTAVSSEAALEPLPIRRDKLRTARRALLHIAAVAVPLCMVLTTLRLTLLPLLAARVDGEETLLFDAEFINQYADQLDAAYGAGTYDRTVQQQQQLWSSDKTEQMAKQRARFPQGELTADDNVPAPS
eukprot:21575-Heterococcus_DN1.PRE.1